MTTNDSAQRVMTAQPNYSPTSYAVVPSARDEGERILCFYNLYSLSYIFILYFLFPPKESNKERAPKMTTYVFRYARYTSLYAPRFTHKFARIFGLPALS